jgi:hypothetical protein
LDDLIAAIEDASHPAHQMLSSCRMTKLALGYVYWRTTVKRRGMGQVTPARRSGSIPRAHSGGMGLGVTVQALLAVVLLAK